jgi:hypothetical protein
MFLGGVGSDLGRYVALTNFPVFYSLSIKPGLYLETGHDLSLPSPLNVTERDRALSVRRGISSAVDNVSLNTYPNIIQCNTVGLHTP